MNKHIATLKNYLIIILIIGSVYGGGYLLSFLPSNVLLGMMIVSIAAYLYVVIYKLTNE